MNKHTHQRTHSQLRAMEVQRIRRKRLRRLDGLLGGSDWRKQGALAGKAIYRMRERLAAVKGLPSPAESIAARILRALGF